MTIPYLQKIEKLLDMPPAEKAEVLRELESHLMDRQEELINSGMEEAQAQSEAEQRIGPPEDVAYRLTAVHNTASWKSALLTALPFLASIIILLLSLTKSPLLRLLPLTLVGTIASIVCIREFIRGRRPIWLVTWLPMAVICVYNLAQHLAAMIYGSGIEFKVKTLAGLVLVVITFIVAQVTRKWQNMTSILCIIYCVCTIPILSKEHVETLNAYIVLAAYLVFILMLVMFARSIFEMNRYSNAIQASMFLFAAIILRYPAIFTLPELYSVMVTTLLMVISFIYIFRAPTRVLKEKRLNLAIFSVALVCGLFNPIIHSNPNIWMNLSGFVATTIIQFGLIRYVVCFPIWMDRERRQADLPTVVQ